MSINVLGTDFDKKGTELLIKHSDNICFTPAYTFFLRELASTIDNKNLPPYIWWDDQEPGVIWAEDKGQVVGLICYDDYSKKMMPHLSIILTAVAESYRQRGIHQIMNRYFEEEAKKQNCIAVRATVHLNNHVRLKSAEKDNLSPLMLIMSKELQ